MRDPADSDRFGRAWKLSDIDFRALDAAAFRPVDVTRDDTVEIIFTSGATAEPKGVVLTHRNVLANIIPVERESAQIQDIRKPFSPIRFLNLLPLSHMFGQAMATFVPPMLDGTVVFIRGYNPHEIVRQVKARRISVLVSVPKILDVLADHVARLYPDVRESPAGRRGRREAMVAIPCRASPLRPEILVVRRRRAPLEGELEAFWRRLGFVVVQGYGLTETAPIVTLNHPFATSKGSVGKPIGGVDVRIAADGEILVRGENVTTGYYGAPDTTQAAFEGGWFHTGDIGEIDEAGRFHPRAARRK
jgi:long-chain acyl-CoA synthetase